jgi:hypothetical protein
MQQHTFEDQQGETSRLLQHLVQMLTPRQRHILRQGLARQGWVALHQLFRFPRKETNTKSRMFHFTIDLVYIYIVVSICFNTTVNIITDIV